MLNIGKVTQKILDRTPFIREALEDNLINVSSLARKIKPEVEEELKKEVKDAAIIMAIKRLEPSYYQRIEIKIKQFMSDLGDMIVRSDLINYTYKDSDTLFRRNAELLKEIEGDKDIFYTVCKGVSEITVITTKKIQPLIEKIFAKETIKSKKDRLSAITIKLPNDNTEISGIYYYFLKKLAWNGINITEVVSTTNEFTIVVSSDVVDQAFSVLIDMKR